MSKLRIKLGCKVSERYGSKVGDGFCLELGPKTTKAVLLAAAEIADRRGAVVSLKQYLTGILIFQGTSLSKNEQQHLLREEMPDPERADVDDDILIEPAPDRNASGEVIH